MRTLFHWPLPERSHHAAGAYGMRSTGNGHIVRSILASMCVTLLLLGGCSEDVTVASINHQKAELQQALRQLGVKASATSEETVSAHEQLRDYLRAEELSDRKLQKLEQRLDRVTSAYQDLQAQLDDAEGEGDALFSLLETRAKENRTRKFRKELLRKIDEKQNLLEDRLEAAEDVMETLGDSVQKYDDIVGYLQVNQGLDGVEGILADVQKAMDNSAGIDAEIQRHIDEGMEVIASL